MTIANNTGGNGKWSTTVWQKRFRALELRKAGFTYQAIGTELGVSHGHACQYVQAALKESIREPAEAVRHLEVERLDALWNKCWPKIMAGDLKAVDVALRIMQRRSALMGLDVARPALVLRPGRCRYTSLHLVEFNTRSRVVMEKGP
jgi:hypothetical protein